MCVGCLKIWAQINNFSSLNRIFRWRPSPRIRCTDQWNVEDKNEMKKIIKKKIKNTSIRISKC